MVKNNWDIEIIPKPDLTINQLCNRIENLLYGILVPENVDDTAMFFQWDWDSDTYWITLGVPQEWLVHEDDEEED